MQFEIKGNEAKEVTMERRDTIISVIRVIGMLFIISCHVFSWLGVSFLSQALNVGVYIFLFISGLLYSGKSIERPRQWLFRRWKKLGIPILIWIIFVILYMAITQNVFPSVLEIGMFVFNLQGLSWIITPLPKVGSYGYALADLGHLWFVTIIFICYLLLIPYKRFEHNRNVNYSKSFRTYIIYIILLLFFSLLFSVIRINVMYITCFYIGYLTGKRKMTRSWRYFTISLGLIFVGILIRITGKRLIDNTSLYDIGLVGLSQILVTLGFLYTIYFINGYDIVKKISGSALVVFLDRISYYLYITHYFFLGRGFGIDRISSSVFIQLICFFMISLITAMLLRTFTSFLICIMERDKATVQKD